MSQSRFEDIECPHCHAKGKFEVWDSINVDLNPKLREQLFNEELFMFHCPSCGQVIGIPFSTIYHDMTHAFMLFFDFYKPDDYKYDSMEMPDAEVLGIKKKYVFRIVFGLNLLKEKILILEHGLNDVAIERMKYMISHVTFPDLAEKGCTLYFAGENPESEKYKRGSLEFLYENEKGQEMSLEVPKEDYYEHCLACELDLRMDVGSCQCVDQDWMDEQMKKEEER